MRSVGTLTGKQFFDVVCHQSLKPGNSIRSRKADQAAIPGLAKNCGTMPGGMVKLGMLNRDCHSG
jgi:hypothetical protein